MIRKIKSGEYRLYSLLKRANAETSEPSRLVSRPSSMSAQFSFSNGRDEALSLRDLMDKPKHPQVIRTWKVERIRKPVGGSAKSYPKSRPKKAK